MAKKSKDQKKEHIEENIKKIQDELENKRKLPKNAQEIMNRQIQINILIAITIMLYFYFLNLGFTNIEQLSFLTDLKVFSITILFVAIILFEISYKKDDGKYCIFGIEILVLAISTLFLTYVVVFLNDRFKMILVIASLVFAIYYIAKSIILYAKIRREFNKNKSDVKYIVKK